MKNLGEATSRMFQTKSKVFKEVYNLYNNIQTHKDLAIETEQNEAIVEDQSSKINHQARFCFDLLNLEYLVFCSKQSYNHLIRLIY